jgi:FixJ family two-component response regulator
LSPRETVFVVDDEPEVRKALERLLRASGLQVDVSASAQEFLERSEGVQSGCAVLDYQMPGLTGLDLQDVLADRGGGWQIVFLSGQGDVPKTVRAMKAGAVDFLVKPADGTQLVAAVRRALERAAEAKADGASVADARARVATLSARERQVLGHVIAGRLNKQIAGELGTAEKTVKIQRAAMMEKMGVRSVADLVRLAAKAGIEPS